MTGIYQRGPETPGHIATHVPHRTEVRIDENVWWFNARDIDVCAAWCKVQALFFELIMIATSRLLLNLSLHLRTFLIKSNCIYCLYIYVYAYVTIRSLTTVLYCGRCCQIGSVIWVMLAAVKELSLSKSQANSASGCSDRWTPGGIRTLAAFCASSTCCPTARVLHLARLLAPHGCDHLN